jgi:hypothetical protein
MDFEMSHAASKYGGTEAPGAEAGKAAAEQLINALMRRRGAAFLLQELNAWMTCQR